MLHAHANMPPKMKDNLFSGFLLLLYSKFLKTSLSKAYKGYMQWSAIDQNVSLLLLRQVRYPQTKAVHVDEDGQMSTHI